MAEESFVYVLCEDGKLYARWFPSFRQAANEVSWQKVTYLGKGHSRVTFDCGYIYGVNEQGAVDFQGFKGANEDRWARLSRGTVVDIAGYGGEIYGLGASSEGDRVYIMTRNVDKYNKNPWTRVSKGRKRAIAIDGDTLYGLGNNNWVYQQSLCNLTEDSDWHKSFELESTASSLSVSAGGYAFAVIDGKLYYRDPSYKSWNRVLGPGANKNVVAVFVAPAFPNAQLRRWKSEHAEDHVQDNCSSDCQPSSGEDLTKLSVKELKTRIEDLGAVVPLGTAEKSELVAVLRDAMSAASGSQANVVDEGAESSREIDFDVGAIIVASADVSASGEGYLTLRVGDEIEMLHLGDRAVDSERGWLYGKSLASGEMGWLQVEHTKIRSLEKSTDVASLEKSDNKQDVSLGRAKVYESITSVGPGYIPLQVGTTVMVEHIGSNDSEESGWLFGHDLSSGCRGWFPAKALQEPA